MPHTNHPLTTQWGPPIGIENARRNWSTITQAAKKGTITLINRNTPGNQPDQLAALTPLHYIPDPDTHHPTHNATTARLKLGQLITHATQWPTGQTQLITHGHNPIAALIPATALTNPTDTHNINIHDLLHDGGTITITLTPHEPEETDTTNPHYLATATTPDGTNIGSGTGPTMATAITRITSYPTWEPWNENEDPWLPNNRP